MISLVYYITEKFKINKKTIIDRTPKEGDKILVFHEMFKDQSGKTASIYVAKIKKFYGNTFTVEYIGLSKDEASNFLDHAFEKPKTGETPPFFAHSSRIKDLCMDALTAEEEINKALHSENKYELSGFTIQSSTLTATELYKIILDKLER